MRTLRAAMAVRVRLAALAMAAWRRKERRDSVLGICIAGKYDGALVEGCRNRARQLTSFNSRDVKFRIFSPGHPVRRRCTENPQRCWKRRKKYAPATVATKVLAARKIPTPEKSGTEKSPSSRQNAAAAAECAPVMSLKHCLRRCYARILTGSRHGAAHGAERGAGGTANKHATGRARASRPGRAGARNAGSAARQIPGSRSRPGCEGDRRQGRQLLRSPGRGDVGA